MICGVVNDAVALIDETLGAAIFCRVIDIGFVVSSFGQKTFVVPKFVAANHHADGCPRVEIPLVECVARFRFVKRFAFVLCDVVCWQLVKFAQVCSHRIARRVFA